MTRARIIGIGAYAPTRILTNEELGRMVETSDEWIVQRTGIRERRVVDESEATSDLAVGVAGQFGVPRHRAVKAVEQMQAAGRCVFGVAA